MITMIDLYGESFNNFWHNVEITYPDMPEAYYEILVDFWEDEFKEELPLEESVRLAHDYVIEHIHDYD